MVVDGLERRSPLAPVAGSGVGIVNLGLTLGLAVLAVVMLHRRFDQLAGPWAGMGEVCLFVAIGAVGLVDGAWSTVNLRWSDRRTAATGLVIGAAGAGTILSVGPSHPALAMVGVGSGLIGAGLIALPSVTLSQVLPLALPLGIIATALLSLLIGLTTGMTRATSLLVPGLVLLAGAVQVTRIGPSPGARVVHIRPMQCVAVGVALVALCAVGVGITALPYKLLHPVVPFGRDMQHPSNIHHIMSTGTAEREPYSIHEFYPDTFSYWASTIGLQARLGALPLLKVLGPMMWLLAALVVFGIGADLFGVRVGLLSLAALAVASFQPRSTVYDGAYIAVLAEYVIGPAALYALYLVVARPSLRHAAALAVIVGGLVQLHIIAFSRFLVIATVFLLLVWVLLRPSRNRGRTVALAAVAAAGIGAPFTWRYAWIYIQSAWLTSQGKVPADAAVFPTVHFPQGFEGLLGQPLFMIVVAAAVLWSSIGYRAVHDRALWLLISCWFWVTFILVLTKILLMPERDLRSMVLVASLMIGWCVDWLARRVAQADSAPLLTATAVACGAVFCAPSAIAHVNFVGSIEVYATPQDIAFMGSLDLSKLPGLVGTDESGVWLPYFGTRDDQVIAAAGGYTGFKWYGKAVRDAYTILYTAIHQPCATGVPAELHGIGIDYLYLGPQPQHWTLPGYAYTPASSLLACSRNFSVAAEDPGLGAYLYKVQWLSREGRPSPPVG